MNSLATAGFVNVAPPSVDFAHAIASVCFLPNVNWRQVTNTVPVRVTATSQNWLPWMPSEIFCRVHV